MNYSNIYKELSELVFQIKEQRELLEDKKSEFDGKTKDEDILLNHLRNRMFEEKERLKLISIKREKYFKKKRRIWWIVFAPFISMIVFAILNVFVDFSNFYYTCLIISSILYITNLGIIPYFLKKIDYDWELEYESLKGSDYSACLLKRQSLRKEKENISIEMIKIKNKVVELETSITRIIYNSFDCFNENSINSYFDIKDRDLYDRFKDLILELGDYKRLEERGIKITEFKCCDDNLYERVRIQQIYDYNWNDMCKRMSDLVVDNFSDIDKNGYVDDRIVGRVRIRKKDR